MRVQPCSMVIAMAHQSTTGITKPIEVGKQMPANTTSNALLAWHPRHRVETASPPLPISHAVRRMPKTTQVHRHAAAVHRSHAASRCHHRSSSSHQNRHHARFLFHRRTTSHLRPPIAHILRTRLRSGLFQRPVQQGLPGRVRPRRRWRGRGAWALQGQDYWGCLLRRGRGVLVLHRLWRRVSCRECGVCRTDEL
ncbi:uncharacterized protein EKO05_0003247 [Ascochyta rabiei]|uniref:uncharacterized protein n=1 Tax=Didymella rabiei TaxID=5454 RepID=UPI0021FFAA3D|nr:uncharacterized protein EKO05_0003247 [Ascochyta rabiei]UPX12708.1 hypothetical protein EKO05_0003247 [Ascochyta rabiei]